RHCKMLPALPRFSSRPKRSSSRRRRTNLRCRPCQAAGWGICIEIAIGGAPDRGAPSLKFNTNLKFTFTRHAEQRIKLYKIDSQELLRRLNALDLVALPQNGERTFTFEGIRSRIGTPIKVVLIR